MTEIANLKAGLIADIAAADTLEALEGLRVGALGKNGVVTGLLKTLGPMSPEERLEKGPPIQDLRESVTAALADKKAALEQAALDAKLAAEKIDMTLPAEIGPQGSVHPVSQVMDELAEIFADLGFSVATGPEIEDDWHNFTALNIPETHPARAMHDTFYFPYKQRKDEDRPEALLNKLASNENPAPMLLRTHTSPVQIRTMKAVSERTGGKGEPIRIIAPGRVYRSDSDATHTPMFHQIEGLVIDKGITLGHLKWTLETFLKAFFEREDIVLRLRPSYFPFTEPSVEVDVGYTLTNGQRVIGGDGDAPGGGWLEVLGSGMVNRRVIEACELDPDEWQGFAFGTGVDRLAMLKYGMNDLRAFFDGDLRWLKHYGFSALDVPTLSGGVGA
ncbi:MULTISPECIES: phenylalanine--tRNA ligase subunit alpha [Sphingobium]|uniref:phenylalanine--tRNA ligase subunit alpha n=1 Tax=Sphingobium TaxID=165695 RepID=UPI00159C80E4|nr:phenylalanine--tRNA ligase subunit alpha [Sphingobium sp. 15-1]